MKKPFKTFLNSVYYKVLKIKSKILYGKPILVLMYHRIHSEIGENLKHLTVSPENFEEQLKYYNENFTILNVKDNWKALKKNGLLLTFDDGYYDNFINALPLLEKYNTPAIFFISTINIDKFKEFWWDRLDYIYDKLDNEFKVPDKLNFVNKNEYSYKNISVFLSEINEEEKDKWLCNFEKLNNIEFKNRESYRSLSIKELQFLENHPLITIGLHTHNHYPLGKLDSINQRKEIKNSLEIFKKYLNYYPDLIALPHGSYNEDTFLILKETSFKFIFMANDYYSNTHQKRKGLISRIIMTNITSNNLTNRLNKFL
ncbi:MAG: polysaccharide deacetylase family protein [Lutibacter sp.]